MQSVLESNDPDQPPNVIETAKKMLSERPANRENWIAVCNSWQELKRSALSDESIKKWQDDNFLTGRQDVVKPIVVRGTPI